MKILFTFFIIIFVANAHAENLIFTGARAFDLYQNLSVPESYGTKSFVSSDNLIKIECSIILYQPVCDLTIVNSAGQKTWDEFKAVLNGPNVTSGEEVQLETPRLFIKCHKRCSIKIIFE